MTPKPRRAKPDATRNAGSSSLLVAAELEEDIVLGRLHPRQRLVEQELVARFDSNRAAVRLALFKLEKDGLVERIPNRGAMVPDLTPDDVMQIYAVREELETMAARIIPLPVCVQDIDDLLAMQERHSHAVDAADLKEVFYSNLDFHKAFFGLCGNPYLIEAIEQFAQKVYIIRSHSSANPAYLAQVKLDHLDMIAALQAGDRDRLAELCRQHLKPSRDSYVRAYRQRFAGVGFIR